MNKFLVEENEGANGFRLTIYQGSTILFTRLYDVTSNADKEAYKADVVEHIGGGGIKRPQ